MRTCVAAIVMGASLSGCCNSGQGSLQGPLAIPVGEASVSSFVAGIPVVDVYYAETPFPDLCSPGGRVIDVGARAGGPGTYDVDAGEAWVESWADFREVSVAHATSGTVTFQALYPEAVVDGGFVVGTFNVQMQQDDGDISTLSGTFNLPLQCVSGA